MMDMMIADLDKEIQEVEVEEKEGQKEYEQFMADSAEKRALDAKSIEDKEGVKADTEAKLLKDEEAKATTIDSFGRVFNKSGIKSASEMSSTKSSSSLKF